MNDVIDLSDEGVHRPKSQTEGRLEQQPARGGRKRSAPPSESQPSARARNSRQVDSGRPAGGKSEQPDDDAGFCILIDDEGEMQQQSRSKAPTAEAQQYKKPSRQPPQPLTGPQEPASYLLDTCGCELPLTMLQASVRGPTPALPSGMDHPPSPDLSAEQLLHAWQCPRCQASLSHRDLRQLGGTHSILRMYSAFSKQLLPRLPTPSSSAPPTCLACSQSKPRQPTAASYLVPVESLKSLSTKTEKKAAGTARPALSYVQLKQALAVQSLPNSGPMHTLASRLLSHLESSPSSSAGPMLFCTTCAATQPSAPKPPSQAQACGSEPSTSTGGAHLAPRLALLHHKSPGSLASLVVELRDLLLQGSEGKDKEARSKAKPGPKKCSAAGTGYGGATQESGAAAAIQAAAKRQQQVDTQLQLCLQQLRDRLASPNLASGPPAPGQPGRSQAPAFHPPWTVALVLSGELPSLLRLLLQNDSLQDIANRQELYRALLELLRVLSKSQDLVEVFTVSTDSPAEAGGAAGGSAAAASDTSLLAMLQRLNTQCLVYRRSGAELGQGDAEDLAALSMALELNSLYEDVREAVKMWSQAMSCSDDPPAAEGQGGAGPSGSQQEGRQAGGGGRRAQRLARNGTAEQGQEARQQQQQQQQQAAYLKTMQPLLFQEKPLFDEHYFRQSASGSGSGRAASGELMRKRLKRITEEISTLSTSLPLSWESSIWVAVDTERMDVLRALIVPAPDTPYANGFFVFDIYLPPDYPNSPPCVQFLTTGGGRIRFNPNLYNCGKVCLSLLGTWAGPSWQPGTSTLLQVLISINAMILVTDPFFNEPGFERQMGTASGKQQSRAYNEQVRVDTLTAAILPALTSVASSSSSRARQKSSLPGWHTFSEVITAHVLAKQQEIKGQCAEWLAESSAPFKQGMKKAVESIEASLKLLEQKEDVIVL